MSKLTYSLHVAWLTLAERRRLDAFQARALRKILRIAPSYYSRVSNADVLGQAGGQKASAMLLSKQLHFMGELARREDTDVLKRCVFEPGTLRPRACQGPRKRGRPKDRWTTSLHQEAVRAAGSIDRLMTLWQDTPAAKSAWHTTCNRHVSHTNA